MKKLKIEVWSDIMCPFCYIGKRLYENALEQFPHKAQVELEWKAFQLNPRIPKNTRGESILDYFAREKGVSVQKAKEMHERIVQMALSLGLEYNIMDIIVANTSKAHQLSHWAKSQSIEKQNIIEELLFKAYFTEGENINSLETLAALAEVAGLGREKTLEVLNSEEFSYEVKQDIQEASNIGISGVPFFSFDRKYTISGAQPAEIFLSTLEKTWNEVKDEKIDIIEGSSCSSDENCE